jgi:hypothetical protein
MCTKVAHLKEGEVRLRRDSSLCNRAISISSARGHARVILSSRSALCGAKASNAYEPNRPNEQILSAANRPDRQARGGPHGSWRGAGVGF